MNRDGQDPIALAQQIAGLLASGTRRVVFAESCTGGLVSCLLAQVPGISQFLCGSAVTYRETTKAAWLGVSHDVLRDYSAVSLIVAEGMATAVLDNTPQADISLSVTGHLGPDAPPQQDGIVYVGSATRTRTPPGVFPLGVYEHRLKTTERIDRQQEAASLVLSHLEQILLPGSGSNIDQPPESLATGQAAVRIAGRWIIQDLQDPAHRRVPVLFPGSFNPLHPGHRGIYDAATLALGVRPQFEIAIQNVDKPRLPQSEILRRTCQFPTEHTLWLTQLPTFVEKARAFPGSTFLVGSDTITRIADRRYYAGNDTHRDSAIAEIADLGCRFLVYGRLMDGLFATLADLKLPPQLAKICQGVSADLFRSDVSSSEIRQAGDGDSTASESR